MHARLYQYLNVEMLMFKFACTSHGLQPGFTVNKPGFKSEEDVSNNPLVTSMVCV